MQFVFSVKAETPSNELSDVDRVAKAKEWNELLTSRNVLRLMIATCGFAEVRVMATQRLELWLSNQKVCFRFRYIFGKARCNKRFDLCR